MNRREFITVSTVGAAGLALPKFVLAEAHKQAVKHIKYLPENMTVLVNESSKACELPRHNWPAEWQILGHTKSKTKLTLDSNKKEAILTEIFVEKLDIKLTGVPVNPSKVRQLAFVLDNKLTDGKIHLLSRNALLTRVPRLRSEEKWQAINTDLDLSKNASYIATFLPFTTKAATTPSYFEMTFFSGYDTVYYDDDDLD